MSLKLAGLKPYRKVLEAILEAASDSEKEKELYLVGGAVRDLLLDRKVLDLDFAVKGSGTKLASKLARTLKGAFVPLSEEDDEARVVIHKELILDFRGFKDSITDDLEARDFTINSIAVDVHKLFSRKKTDVLLDPFGGQKDLARGVVRKVGERSIKSDPLRILRAYRFAAQLGFRIDPALEREAERTSLAGVASERIAYELMLILSQKDAYLTVNRMITAGLMRRIFPFDDFWQDYQVRSHSLLVLDTLERILYYRNESFPPLVRGRIEEIVSDSHRAALLKLAALFHDVSKPETRMQADDGSLHFYGHDTKGAKKVSWILSKVLRFSNAATEKVEQIVARHMHLHLLATSPQLTERAMRRFMRTCGECATDIMILDLADGFATAGRTRHLERTIVDILKLAAEDAKRADFKPLVNGHDLIAMGLEPGPLFKQILGELEELQWERKIATKEEGLALVKRKLDEGAYENLPPQDEQT